MTIRNANGFEALRPAGFDGVFDWDFLDLAWRRSVTGITPMDIDAVVERNGLFLMFETKSPGADIPRGQQLALSRLVRVGRGAISVISLHAKLAADITGWEIWRYDHRCVGGVDQQRHHGDATALLDFCGRWFAHASGVCLPPLFRRKARADLFNDLISSPVERATLYLQELADIERACVLDRFRGAP